MWPARAPRRSRPCRSTLTARRPRHVPWNSDAETHRGRRPCRFLVLPLRLPEDCARRPDPEHVPHREDANYENQFFHCSGLRAAASKVAIRGHCLNALHAQGVAALKGGGAALLTAIEVVSRPSVCMGRSPDFGWRLARSAGVSLGSWGSIGTGRADGRRQRFDPGHPERDPPARNRADRRR